MIAALFRPLDIECLVKTAVELWEGADVADLSERQQEMLSRARDAVSAEYADLPDTSSEVTAFLSSRPAGRVWVLRRWDRHHDQVTLWADEGSALAALAGHVRTFWGNVVGNEGVPDRPPTDDREAVDLYYGPSSQREDEDYRLYAEDIGRRGLTRLVQRDHRFPDEAACTQANLSAVFHPQTHPDDDGLPCVEVHGILVFTYLDHEIGAVRVSVHLDTADDRLVRPDGTVPLRVEVGDTVILDDSSEGAPRQSVLGELLDAADDRQAQAIREAAFASGILWRCPSCQWDNPREATCCEGPGPCRTPKPAKTD